MALWSHDTFVSALALSLLHSLWQGALLGLLGLALSKRLKLATPDVRCGAFSLLLLTLFVVWLGTFVCEYQAHVQTVTIIRTTLTTINDPKLLTAPASPTGSHSLVAVLECVSPYLVALWTLGVCVLSLRHIGGFLLLQRLSRTGITRCPPAWEECAARLTTRMGIRRRIQLRCSTRIDVPFAFGLFKSSILLPLHAMTGLAPEQAEALIAHELAHFARHDVVLNFLQVCIETILFYHPVVRWLSLQIRAAREQACDDLAIQVVGDRAVYARALFSLEEARASIPQLALGAKGDTSKMTNTHLIRRIQRVLGTGGPERHDPRANGVLALGAATLGLATLLPVYAHAQQGNKSSQANTVTRTKTDQTAPETHVSMNIHGKKIELNLDTDALMPDTKVKVDGTEGRFGDLPDALQKQLRDSVKIVPNTVAISLRALPSLTPSPATQAAGTTSVMLDINGDRIELGTTHLTVDSPVKVNGTAGRFGDLTDKQQQQLRDAVKNMAEANFIPLSRRPMNATVMVTKDSSAASNDTVGRTLTVTEDASADQAVRTIEVGMSLNGDKIELNTTDPKSDTPVSVNGTVGRFDDLTTKQQKQIREQLPTRVTGAPVTLVQGETMPAAAAEPRHDWRNGQSIPVTLNLHSSDAASATPSVPAFVVSTTTTPAAAPEVFITSDPAQASALYRVTAPVQATATYSVTEPGQVPTVYHVTGPVPAPEVFRVTQTIQASATSRKSVKKVYFIGKKSAQGTARSIRVYAPAVPATPSIPVATTAPAPVAPATPSVPTLGIAPATPSTPSVPSPAVAPTTPRTPAKP